ncbi:hypothetical protein [Baaleninema simplex]|uniref:hypothetical protein n=1 Tax=Baaleninema simplex TaxID=2862350 RepID=UPI00130EF824|nr:hypothetical protein [Baaleninema simplex]
MSNRRFVGVGLRAIDPVVATGVKRCCNCHLGHEDEAIALKILHDVLPAANLL